MGYRPHEKNIKDTREQKKNKAVMGNSFSRKRISLSWAKEKKENWQREVGEHGKKNGFKKPVVLKT